MLLRSSRGRGERRTCIVAQYRASPALLSGHERARLAARDDAGVPVEIGAASRSCGWLMASVERTLRPLLQDLELLAAYALAFAHLLGPDLGGDETGQGQRSGMGHVEAAGPSTDQQPVVKRSQITFRDSDGRWRRAGASRSSGGMRKYQELLLAEAGGRACLESSVHRRVPSTIGLLFSCLASTEHDIWYWLRRTQAIDPRSVILCAARQFLREHPGFLWERHV